MFALKLNFPPSFPFSILYYHGFFLSERGMGRKVRGRGEKGGGGKEGKKKRGGQREKSSIQHFNINFAGFLTFAFSIISSSKKKGSGRYKRKMERPITFQEFFMALKL